MLVYQRVPSLWDAPPSTSMLFDPFRPLSFCSLAHQGWGNELGSLLLLRLFLVVVWNVSFFGLYFLVKIWNCLCFVCIFRPICTVFCFEGRGLLIEMFGFSYCFSSLGVVPFFRTAACIGLLMERLLYTYHIYIYLFIFTYIHIGCFYFNPFGGCQISARNSAFVFWWFVSGTNFTHTKM